MTKLALKGHPKRGREVIQLLVMLGGKSNGNMNGYNDDLYYYIAKDGVIYCSGIEYEELACKYRLFTLEEFKEKFPYEVGDKVITTSNNVFRIKEMMWNNKEIVYSLAYGEGTLGWYNTAELRPYKEEDIEKIESINYNELEQQLDEISAKKPTESLNKCMDEEMKKEYKIGQNITYRDRIDCMIFHSKIVDIKDGIYYLENRDEIKYENILNEYNVDEYVKQCKEGVNLQELERRLDEALAKETPESLNKWLDEETMEEKGDEPKAPILSNRYDYAEGKCGYVIPDGYEFDYIKEGFQTEIILKPKKPQYPKTYKECCSVLGIEDDLQFVYENIDGRHINPACISHYRMKKLNLYDNFEDLITCRDAYWKIAGKEMGLDKPWKPDWCNENKLKYCMECSFGTIDKTVSIVNGCFLAFPTKEMRDAFCENFKDLIEQCKELL